MMMAASYAPSTCGAIRMSGTPGNCMIGGGAGSAFTRSACLPIARSAYAIASCDPIESPSGREWDESTKRCRALIASAIRMISGFVVIVGSGAAGAQVLEQLFDPILTGDRFVVDEFELGHAPQPQPRSDLPPQERNRAMQRAVRLAPRALVAERREEHAGVLEIGRDLHPGDRHEADPRIVHLAREQLAELSPDLIGDAI